MSLTIGLGVVFIVVLLAPFLIKRVETNLEAFLLIMGAITATIAGVWSPHLVREALVESIKIEAIMVFGAI